MKNSITYFFILSIIFLTSCSKEDIGTTETGFNYKIVSEGEGVKPKDGDYVFFHVDMLADGEVQYDSREGLDVPAIQMTEDAKGNIINKAMLECLSHTRPGDSLILDIPMDSLRSIGMPTDDSTKMLTYRLRITEVLDEQAYQEKISAERDAAELKAAEVRKRLPDIEQFVDETYRYINSGKGSNDIKTTASGLQYIIHEEGNGEQLEPGNIASVHYYGVLKSDGKMFDSSWTRGREFQFALGQGQVIKGWDEGVALLKKGAKATLIVPSELGYGKMGSPPAIPEDADLIFYIEVPE